ncbi:MAG: polyprenyl synthetase family protein, partial [Gemmatimonadota bacterium]
MTTSHRSLRGAPPPLAHVQRRVRARLRDVEETIRRLVIADFDAVGQVSDYLVRMRGKLFRPTLLLLANEVGGRPGPKAIPLAAVVELVHLATLVHDDAVDHSVLRRGMPTVNAVWSHQVAIIMGDYLYSRSVSELARLGDVEPIGVLARAANAMTVGEMRQLVSHDALDFSEEEYLRLIDCKTASLMSAACEMGALAGSAAYREPLARYGYELGMAFQITDDLLDYTARMEVMGKPCGNDLREHKVTLPLIAALPRVTAAERWAIDALFADPEPPQDAIAGVIEIADRRGGLEEARQRARAYG